MTSLHTKPDITVFAKLCEQQTDLNVYPLAQAVEKNVLCYAGDTLRAAEQDKSLRTQLLQEISRALQYGPGVLAITAAYTDMTVLEEQNTVFETILQQEADKQTGDHFAKAGANSRIWNSLQKSALLNPQSFIDYYKNPLLALVSEAWLGPDFQMTAQVNIVRPGGKAQSPHRDYHLGFQSTDVLEHYPSHVHNMSAMLTLQGAIAHTDMPLESGPTLLLPYSQQYAEGYLAWREPAFKDYFARNAIQLPLKQGDAVFFNPALFHAAGSNRTNDFHRSANLLQVSSAFGRAMESVDRYAISQALYPHLLNSWQQLSDSEQDAVLSSGCEGYSFPTNLDTDPPLGGMAPETHKALTRRALEESWTEGKFRAESAVHKQRRSA